MSSEVENLDIYPFRLIIFDFDLTLVDTRPVEVLRAARNWREVMSKAPSLKVYAGINGLLRELHAQGQTLAIVTMSPDTGRSTRSNQLNTAARRQWG